MSFWQSELGNITGTAEDAFAKSFKLIPDDTMALAKINSFTNQSFKTSDFKYLQIEWLITDGEFKGQKVQQKLKVFGGDSYDKDSEKTRHRALNMLKLIYKLFGLSPSHDGPLTDKDLLIFNGRVAGINIRETMPNEKGKQYNWIAEVHPAKDFKSVTGPGIPDALKESFPKYKSPIDSAFSRNANTQLEEMDRSFDNIPFD